MNEAVDPKPAEEPVAAEPKLIYIWRLNIMAEPVPGTVLTALEVAAGVKALAEESYVLVESTSATNPMAATVADDGQTVKDPTQQFGEMYERITGRKLIAVQARLFGHRQATPDAEAGA